MKMLLTLVMLIGLAPTALAQNTSLGPTFGYAKLNAGFSPDPHIVGLTAGGRIRTKLGGVNSWVANAPDFQLFYRAGNLPLTIQVESAADTTLLVNLPDGTWIANDDGAGKRNPMIRLARPMSGRYDIWVGTYNGGLAPALLKFTELRR
ncbi:MAG: hypothetical protein L0Y72_21985 [Gemmataceae bacterium]|nr:hypothetical protein [Gemmataceae bacterium]